MSSPDLLQIFGGPEYVGPVDGVKQEYQVFRTGRGDYVVFSRSTRSPTSFHMTFMASSKVTALRGAVSKKGSTTTELLKNRTVVEAFGTAEREALYFEVLTALYVLAALDQLEITKLGRNLVFTPKQPAEATEPVIAVPIED